MTTIAAGLRTYLIAGATVATLVGTRVYPSKLPQKPTLPAISYQRISGDRVHSTDGASGLARIQFQIDVWGSTYGSVDALFEAVRKRLDGYRGAVGAIVTQGIFLERERDMYDDEAELYRRSADFTVWTEEST